MEGRMTPNMERNANGSWYCSNCRRIVILFDEDEHACEQATKTNIIGTNLGPDFHAPAVQRILQRALDMLARVDDPDLLHQMLAQDVLDVLVTAMMNGAFRDHASQASTVVDFPVFTPPFEIE